MINTKSILNKAIYEKMRERKIPIQSKEKYNKSFWEFVNDISSYKGKKNKLGERHKIWCDSLEKTTAKRILTLKPRGSFKSSIITIAYPIYRLMNNPNIRILIASDTYTNACNFVNQIRKTILSFDFIEERLTFKVANRDELDFLEHTLIHKEPTISATGALKTIVGKHFDLIIVDDLVNDKDRDSDKIRGKKKEWFRDLSSLLEPEGEIIVVGTRWHMDDIYGDIIHRAKEGSETWYYEIESIYIDNDPEKGYTMPQLFNDERVNVLKEELGSVHFASQYINNPLPPDTQIFPPEIFKTFERGDLGESKLRYFTFLDPSLGKENSDYQALVTVGFDGYYYYIVEVKAMRVHINEMIDESVKTILEYKPEVFGYETNQFQEVLKRDFKQAFDKAGLSFFGVFRGVNNRKSKESRIHSLQGRIEKGRILFPEGWDIGTEGQAFKLAYEQFIYYPATTHDDIPDALHGAISFTLKEENIVKISMSRS